LIGIIKAIVKRDPSMKEVVDLAVAAPKPGKPMNVSVYREQARRTIVNDFGDSARSQSPEFAARAARIFREAPEG
jgi:hypothetical protein